LNGSQCPDRPEKFDNPEVIGIADNLHRFNSVPKNDGYRATGQAYQEAKPRMIFSDRIKKMGPAWLSRLSWQPEELAVYFLPDDRASRRHSQFPDPHLRNLKATWIFLRPFLSPASSNILGYKYIFFCNRRAFGGEIPSFLKIVQNFLRYTRKFIPNHQAAIYIFLEVLWISINEIFAMTTKIRIVTLFYALPIDSSHSAISRPRLAECLLRNLESRKV
jgi:hypothetical protein